MIIASISFIAMAWRVPVSKRLYHIITTMITVIAAISYFAMATGMGVSYHHIRVREQHNHVPDTYKHIYRQVYWARYVDWALTTPLLLLDLSLLANLSGAHILIAVLSDVIMILTGLFAAFGREHNGSKWGWYAKPIPYPFNRQLTPSRYAIACIAYLNIIWQLVVNGRATASARGGKVSTFYASIAGFTILVWTAYPVYVSPGHRPSNS